MNHALSHYFLSAHPTLVVRCVEDQRVLLRFYADVFTRKVEWVGIVKDSQGLHLHSVDVFTDIEHPAQDIWTLFKRLLLTELDGNVELVAFGKPQLTECPQGTCVLTVGDTHVATVSVDAEGSLVGVTPQSGYESLSESIGVLYKALPTEFHFVNRQLTTKYRNSILKNYAQLSAFSKTQLKAQYGVSTTWRAFLDTLDAGQLGRLRDTLSMQCNRKAVHVVRIHDDLHTYVSEPAGVELRVRTSLKLAELKDFSTIIIAMDPAARIVTSQWLKGFLRDSILVAGSDWNFTNRYKFVGFDKYAEALNTAVKELLSELFD